MSYLEYNTKSQFAQLTQQLCTELEADAVFLIVFSKKASGCCCDIRPMQGHGQQFIGREMVKELRRVAEALEEDLDTRTFPAHDPDQYEQTLN